MAYNQICRRTGSCILPRYSTAASGAYRRLASRESRQDAKRLPIGTESRGTMYQVSDELMPCRLLLYLLNSKVPASGRVVTWTNVVFLKVTDEGIIRVPGRSRCEKRIVGGLYHQASTLCNFCQISSDGCCISHDHMYVRTITRLSLRVIAELESVENN